MGSICKSTQLFCTVSNSKFTNSSLFNVCFYVTIGSLSHEPSSGPWLSQKNLTVCFSILGSSLQSTCQSKRSHPSTYLGRQFPYWSALDFWKFKFKKSSWTYVLQNQPGLLVDSWKLTQLFQSFLYLILFNWNYLENLILKIASFRHPGMKVMLQ